MLIGRQADWDEKWDDCPGSFQTECKDFNLPPRIAIRIQKRTPLNEQLPRILSATSKHCVFRLLQSWIFPLWRMAARSLHMNGVLTLIWLTPAWVQHMTI
jgi:hypothetical protein